MNKFTTKAYGYVLSNKSKNRDETLFTIFSKAQTAKGYDLEMFRKDAYGNIICFADYGTDSECGWHVDHIVPQSKGGSDMLSNLQPLHWKTNISLHNIEQGKKYIKTYNTRSCPDPSSVGKQLL